MSPTPLRTSTPRRRPIPLPAVALGAALLLTATTGCAGLSSYRPPRRPSLAEQVQAREVEVVAAGWEPGITWMRGEGRYKSREEWEEARIEPSPEERAVLASLCTAAERARLVEEVVVAAGKGGTRFVRSGRAAPPDMSKLPEARDLPPSRAAQVVSLDGLVLLGEPADEGLVYFGVMVGARQLRSAPADGPREDRGDGRDESRNERRSEGPTDDTSPPYSSYDLAEWQGPSHVAVGAWDPVPRTRKTWFADQGQALRASLAQLTSRGAARLVEELALTAGGSDVEPPCGPRPDAPGHRQLDMPVAGGTLRWKAWAPEERVARGARITYDLRLYRLDGGAALPVLSLDGLQAPSAALPRLEPDAVHAWTVRATLALPDGRRLSTAWAQVESSGNALDQYKQREVIRLCRTQLDPWKSWRFLTKEDATPASPGRSPAPTVAARGGTPPSPDAPLPPLARRAAIERVEVAPLAGIPPVVEYLPGDPGLSAAAVKGALEGVSGGLQASVQCLIVMPICAAVAVPLGAAVGGAIGASAAMARIPGEETRARAAQGLRDAVERPATRVRLEAALRSALPPGVPVAEQGTGAAEGETAAAATGPVPPPAKLEVGLVGARFIGGELDNPLMTLELEVGARLTLSDGEQGYRVATGVLASPMALSTWLADGGERLDGALAALAPRAAAAALEAVLTAPDGAPSPPRRLPPPPPEPPHSEGPATEFVNDLRPR